MTETKTSFGISEYNYALPSESTSIKELADAGDLTSEVEFLQEMGFANAYVLPEDTSALTLVRKAAQATLRESDISADQIDTLFLYRGVTDGKEGDKSEDLDYFSYPVTHLADDLSLSGVRSMALSQQGCGGVFSAIDIARDILATSPKQAVLCVAVDVLPWSGREIMYNVMSDAAGAFLVEKNSKKNTIVDFHQRFQHYYWNAKVREQELLSAYFPMAEQTIRQCLRKADLEASDIDWVVPHNINLRSWKILSGLLDFSEDKIWTNNIARIGHTVSCDHIINLSDMENDGDLQSGDKLLLFTFGFGANWSCLLLEH